MAEQPKKLLIINILDILRKYTDGDHKLSQKEIGERLRKEYGTPADRKAIRRNIEDLIRFGYDIKYKKSFRMVPDPQTGELEKSEIWSDFELVREITDAELRLLIDSVTFSNHIPYGQRKQLIEKLEGLSSKYFRAHMKHVHAVPDVLPQNDQLFFNIEELDNAISAGKQVSFHYLEYGTDKKLHKKCREDGTVREYVINPYQMAAKEGKYYLICNYDKYDDISNYRVDRIADVKVLDTPVKPFESLPWAKESRLDLTEYMRRHVYMFSSEDVRA
ncbi:MAG: WYL domain-containing protein, partial [Clostridia bacterium]|nr:WYL domain-containing protein [Clostridia bacterium]